MSTWLDAVTHLERPSTAEQLAKGKRAAVDLARVPDPPRDALSEERVVGAPVFATTIVVRFRELSEDMMDGMDAITPEALARRRSSTYEPDEAKSETKSVSSSGSLSLSGSDARSTVSFVSQPSVFIESDALASLASKYSASIARSKSRRSTVKTKLSQTEKEVRDAAIKVREAAVVEIKSITHGAAEVRPYWDEGFCYILYHTAREAKFAVHKIHGVISRGRQEDEGLPAMGHVVLNAYMV